MKSQKRSFRKDRILGRDIFMKKITEFGGFSEERDATSKNYSKNDDRDGKTRK